MNQTQHTTGRWLGGFILLLGLLMMIAVFALAVTAFVRVPEALAGRGAAIGQSLAVAAIQIGLLFVMAYVASLLASKGLELFSAARRGAPE
jgi:hypothetical protein